jgi:hypothetical protein
MLVLKNNQGESKIENVRFTTIAFPDYLKEKGHSNRIS